MTISLKEKASAKYGEMKGKLGKKLASMERQVVKIDARITERAKTGREQLAVTLDKAAQKVRRVSNTTPSVVLVALMLAVTASCDSTSPIDLSPKTVGAGTGTGTAGAHGPAPISLGAAANYAIVAKSAVSNVPTSAITGSIALSPAAASFVTGFSLTLPAGGASSTSAQVTGSIFAADYASPTPATLTTAVANMQTAYVDGAGRVTPDHVELASGNIGGLTLPAGLYKWSNTVTIPSTVTLNGGPGDVWIFQIAGGITQSSATHVELTGGAVPANVFWVVFGAVDIGTTAKMQGQVLSQTSIALKTGATANGRLLAQTAVTLAGNTVVKQ